MIEIEGADEINRIDCPRGFDRFGFGNFVRRRDGRPVEAYSWRGGGISWVTTDDELPTRTGICRVTSFRVHHAPAPV